MDKVLHDEDLAAAILDRVLERGRLIHLDGPSGRTRPLKPEDGLLPGTGSARISGTHTGTPTENVRYRVASIRRIRSGNVLRRKQNSANAPESIRYSIGKGAGRVETSEGMSGIEHQPRYPVDGV